MLKWKKPATPKIDAVLATNGAHKANQPHTLIDKTGRIHARVQRAGADWRYWLPGEAASGPFPNINDAKTAAKKKAEESLRQ